MSERAGLPYPDGDPGGLESAAGRLRALAAAVTGDARDAAAAAKPAGWVGPAAAAFAFVATAIAGRLATSAGILGAAAGPVRDLATTLDDAQRQIRRWAREIEEAEGEAQRAQNAVQAARAAAAPALTGGNPLAASPLDTHVVAAVQAAARAQGEVDELRTRYRAKAQRLCDEVEDADRSASAAVLDAAEAAPAGGPRSPHAPAVARLFAPVFLFHPGELHLPADPRADLRYPFRWVSSGGRGVPPKTIDGLKVPDDVQFLHGTGAGAPIFYRVRKGADGSKVIEYWVYRRHNDFRHKGLPKGVHRGDWEAVSVKLDRAGRPKRVAYSQHEAGCSQPYEQAEKRRGHPVAFSAKGSGANYPVAGAYDEVPGPYDDLASGQGKGDKIVHAGDNLVDYDGSSPARFDGRYGHDASPKGPHHQQHKFAPDSATWRKDCHEPAKAGG